MLDKRTDFIVSIKGIVLHVRDLGKIKFLIVTNGENIVQVVYKGKEKVRRGDCIKLSGVLEKDERAPGGFEIRTSKIKFLNKVSEEEMDFWSIYRMKKDKKIKLRPIVLRIPKYMKVFRIYSDVVHYLRVFFRKLKYLEVFTPKIVKIGIESGSEVFSILYFDKDAYLAQSNQLYKQMLMASGIKGVFEVGSYFRAESSHTNRHLSEFRGFDVEVNYVEDYCEIMEILKRCIRYSLKKIGIKVGKDLPKVKYEEVVKILKERYGYKARGKLNSESEILLYDYFKKEYDADLFFVTDFPYEETPFYHMRNGKYTYSFDLIYKGVEIASGSKREHRYDVLIKQIKDKGINPDRLRYYLEIFRRGVPPHGGFCIGIERLVKQALNLDDIKDVALFPRDPNIIEP